MKIKINENRIKETIKEMINKNLIKIEIENYNIENLINELIKKDKYFLIRIDLNFLYEKKYLMKNENYLFMNKYYIKLNDLKEIENYINDLIYLYKLN